MTPDVSHTPGSPNITLTNSGVYLIIYSVSGAEPSQFALFIDGVPVNGSVYGSGAGTQQNTGVMIVPVSSGNVLTLVNHSSAAAVTLASDIGGTQPNVNASIAIAKLG